MLVKSDWTSKDTSLWSSGICIVFIASMKLSVDCSLCHDLTMSLSFLSRLNACNSSFVKLQSVSEADCRVEAILLLMSSLVDSGSCL